MGSHKSSATQQRRKKHFTGPAVMQMLERMRHRSDEELGREDVALTNLLCAIGLLHAENLDIPRCLDQINKMAKRVRSQTRRNLYRFHRRPKEWKNSEAYWRVGMMITVLQQDIGVRYDPWCVKHPNFDFRDSRRVFLHGILFGDGGTCASMPVLYVAISRRLGYPLKLVHAKGHVFARWDDPKGRRWGEPARFNIEATGQGFSSFPDERYRTEPAEITDAEFATGAFLRSLTPREELASFLAGRGSCLLDTRRFSEAARMFHWSVMLAPRDPYYPHNRAFALALSGVPVPPRFVELRIAAAEHLARLDELDKDENLTTKEKNHVHADNRPFCHPRPN